VLPPICAGMLLKKVVTEKVSSGCVSISFNSVLGLIQKNPADLFLQLCFIRKQYPVS